MKLQSLLALLATAGMFGYAVYNPDLNRTIAASVFGVFAGWVFHAGREKITVAPPSSPPSE